MKMQKKVENPPVYSKDAILLDGNRVGNAPPPLHGCRSVIFIGNAGAPVILVGNTGTHHRRFFVKCRLVIKNV